MNAFKMNKKTKCGKSAEPVHQSTMGGSSHMKGIIPATNRPLSSFYSMGPLLSLKGLIQPKLTIGQPNDRYEREADQVADQVMRMPEPGGSLGKTEKESSLVQRQSTCPECPEKEEVRTKPLVSQITPLIQRQEEEEEEEVQPQLKDGSQVQRQEEEEEEEQSLQTKPIHNRTPTATSHIRSNINSVKGGGQMLPHSVRSYFEPRFGANFRQVRIHTNATSAQTAQSVNAKAFTLGKDIVFGAGQYSPWTSTGRKLLAHELTHVVQQGNHVPSRYLQSPETIQRKKLDPQMVSYANQELWTRHPELKKRTLTKSKADAALRREWWRYYTWGKATLSKGNCYRYAMNDPLNPKKKEVHSPFPGGKDPGGHITCNMIMNGAKKAGAVDATKSKPCTKGLRKIAGVIQDKSAPGWNDYHWYRQERNGLWSHKRGTGPVEYKDAAGNPITDPDAANRKYPGRPEYDKFCGYLCIPNTVDLDTP